MLIVILSNRSVTSAYVLNVHILSSVDLDAHIEQFMINYQSYRCRRGVIIDHKTVIVSYKAYSLAVHQTVGRGLIERNASCYKLHTLMCQLLSCPKKHLSLADSVKRGQTISTK